MRGQFGCNQILDRFKKQAMLLVTISAIFLFLHHLCSSQKGCSNQTILLVRMIATPTSEHQMVQFFLLPVLSFLTPPPQGTTLGVFDTFSYLANFIGCNQPAEILSKHYIYIWVPHYISQMCPWNQYSIRKEKNKVKINQSVYYLKSLLMISAYCLSSYPGKKFNVAKTTYSYLRQS